MVQGYLKTPAITLYGVPRSHPTAAVELALQLKRLDYKRVDRLPVLHKVQHRILFGQGTAPAMKLGSRSVVGSSKIFAALDELRGEPAMFPNGPFGEEVRTAARWAEVELQDRARRCIYQGLTRQPKALGSYARDAQLPIPTSVALALARPVILAEVAIHRASARMVHQDLALLPGVLDFADELVGRGPRASRIQTPRRCRLQPRWRCWRRWMTSHRCSPDGHLSSSRSTWSPMSPGISIAVHSEASHEGPYCQPEPARGDAVHRAP